MLKESADLCAHRLNQILRIEFELQAALSGADVDGGEQQAGVVNISGKRLLHADGGTAAADISRQGQQFLHRDKVALLVAGDFGGKFQVYFVLAGNDADEVAGLVAVEYQGFEYLVDVLAQAGGNVDGTEVVLIYFVRDEFVRYLGFIKKPCGICLIDFHFINYKLLITNYNLVTAFFLLEMIMEVRILISSTQSWSIELNSISDIYSPFCNSSSQYLVSLASFLDIESL